MVYSNTIALAHLRQRGSELVHLDRRGGGAGREGQGEGVERNEEELVSEEMGCWCAGECDVGGRGGIEGLEDDDVG